MGCSRCGIVSVAVDDVVPLLLDGVPKGHAQPEAGLGGDRELVERDHLRAGAELAEEGQKWEEPSVEWVGSASDLQRRVVIRGGYLLKPWVPEVVVVEGRAFLEISANNYDLAKFVAGRVNSEGARILSRVRLIDRVRQARDAALAYLGEQRRADPYRQPSH